MYFVSIYIYFRSNLPFFYLVRFELDPFFFESLQIFLYELFVLLCFTFKEKFESD